MLHRLAGLALAVLALLAFAGTAAAAPVTVNLRIEGPTATVFEGPVTTDVRPFQFTAGADTAPHECDATAVNTGTSAVPVPTRGAAITAAALSAPFSTSGAFSVQFGSPSFDEVGGQPTAFDPATSSFLVEYKNGVAASVGACADPIANGDDVLFAYGNGNEGLLGPGGPGELKKGRGAVGGSGRRPVGDGGRGVFPLGNRQRGAAAPERPGGGHRRRAVRGARQRPDERVGGRRGEHRRRHDGCRGQRAR